MFHNLTDAQSISNINSQLDATITDFLDNSNQLNMFQATSSLPAGDQQAASPVHHTTSHKQSSAPENG